MKRFFLIPLMACFTCVMAWAEDAHVSNIADLKSAIANASVGTIYLDADIEYTDDTQGNQLNIARSLTIDGQGHTLSGYGKRTSSVYNIFSINNGGGSAMVDVVFKDLNMIITKNTVSNDRLARVIETRGNIHSIELNNVTIGVADYTKTYAVGLQIGGSQASKATLIITNSTINVGNPGYPVLSWNPYDMTATNSEFAGYCGLYFKGVNGSTGSRGSIVNATNCNFECPNVYSGESNAFSCFPLEDDGITLNLHNCGMNIEQIGDQNQALVTTNNSDVSRRTEPVNVTISGDNSHFNTMGGVNKTIQNLYLQGSYKYNPYGEINVTITGGTYSVNPEAMYYYDQWVPVEEGNPTQVTVKSVTIPAEYEVKEITMEGVATPLYRVVKKVAEKTGDPSGETLYNLNELVEGEGESAGVNPISSFAVVDSIELEQTVTKAGYVSVGDTATTGTKDSVTVTIPAQKTFVINNGLDVKDNAKVVAEPQSTLIIGEGGIITDNAESIVIEADENGAASLIMDPAITVNQTPNLTVEMKVSQAGKDAYGDYWWHRFAMPVGSLPEAWTKSPNYGTYLYGWNYATNDWEQVAGGSTNMVPWKGYTLTYNEAYNENETVTYTFKGNLVGNTDADLTFEEEGYQFFGNSYTGYMDVLTLINNLTDGNIDQTVWMWNPANQTYSAVPLDKLSDPAKAARLKAWQKEVAPMQTFIMRLRGATSANETVSYADAIWGNPRYGNSAAPAPRRLAASADEAYMEIVVTAANGQSDRVDFTVNSERNDAFENGFDASKYMNERHINLYATVAGEDYTSVATDNIEGKTISLQTKNDITYTISFENVETTEYALLDKLTNITVIIAEGNTYEFAAQPNSVIEGRFEIIKVANTTTAIENTEIKANAKGIYTITGQYLGEDFKALPAGVYVINGVKIVK